LHIRFETGNTSHKHRSIDDSPTRM
jgi:hypothetical protein